MKTNPQPPSRKIGMKQKGANSQMQTNTICLLSFVPPSVSSRFSLREGVRGCVFLIGFMGSGKTTFGKKLAVKLKLEFVDLDQAVITNYSREETRGETKLQITKSPITNHQSSITVKQIVEENGLPYFRAIESETLRLLDVNNKVISTGGGTPCHFDNMEWMKRRGVVIFLNVDEGVLFSRLKNTDMEERPLLNGLDEAGLENFIHEKLQERLPIYTQANITFNPVTQKVEELVEMLK